MTTNDDDKPQEPTRRDVLDAALAGGTVLLGATGAYPIVRFLSAKGQEESGATEVVAGKASEIAAGTAVAFRFGNKPALLVRDEVGKLRAFIAICTHLDCVVQFRDDIGQGSTFGSFPGRYHSLRRQLRFQFSQKPFCSIPCFLPARRMAQNEFK